jgi:hypothetical protein
MTFDRDVMAISLADSMCPEMFSIVINMKKFLIIFYLNLLTHEVVGNRIKIFEMLDMAVGMNLSSFEVADLITVFRQLAKEWDLFCK